VYHQAEYFCRALSEYEKHKRKIETRRDHLSCALSLFASSRIALCRRVEESSIMKRNQACCACISSALSRYRHVTLVDRFGRLARFLKVTFTPISRFRCVSSCSRMFGDPCQPASTNTLNSITAVWYTRSNIGSSVSFHRSKITLYRRVYKIKNALVFVQFRYFRACFAFFIFGRDLSLRTYSDQTDSRKRKFELDSTRQSRISRNTRM